jgi:hypothetical protein
MFLKLSIFQSYFVLLLLKFANLFLHKKLLVFGFIGQFLLSDDSIPQSLYLLLHLPPDHLLLLTDFRLEVGNFAFVSDMTGDYALPGPPFNCVLTSVATQSLQTIDAFHQGSGREVLSKLPLGGGALPPKDFLDGGVGSRSLGCFGYVRNVLKGQLMQGCNVLFFWLNFEYSFEASIKVTSSNKYHYLFCCVLITNASSYS